MFNFKRKNWFYLLVCILFLFTTILGSPKYGMSISVNNSQFDYIIPIFITETISLSPSISSYYGEDIGMKNSVGLTGRKYGSGEKLRPFWGARFGAILYSPQEEDSYIDYIGGLLYGMEYRFTDNFALGIELQANLTKSADESTEFGNPGKLTFNTASMFFATIYF